MEYALPDFFDVLGVGSDYQRLYCFESSYKVAVHSVVGAFAKACHSLVGFDLNEQPGESGDRHNDVGFDVGDFQRVRFLLEE